MVTASRGKIVITAMPPDQICLEGDKEGEEEEELRHTNPIPNPKMKY